MNRWLTRVGTVRGVGANRAVVFHRVRCADCDGRCGLSFGGGEVPLDADLPDGTVVEVVASVGGLARRAMGVFGWPLGAILVAAAVAEWLSVGDALVVGVMLSTVLAVVGFRAGYANRDQTTRRSPGAPDTVRVILG
ncbi:MAG: SoxR reducing system RseC family protein [Gammaproteobacteria bacterium]|nr:SoxR reducing system RseC family protein [Gammaproteobacteria bacterium]